MVLGKYYINVYSNHKFINNNTVMLKESDTHKNAVFLPYVVLGVYPPCQLFQLTENLITMDNA